MWRSMSTQKTHVLWLKDHDGVFNAPGSYVRGDEWPTLQEAKANAARSPTAFLANRMWMKLTGQRYGFLAMQYGDEELEKLAAEHIKPVIHTTLGYEVKDLRDVSRAGVIDEIMRETVKDSKFTIVDLTHDNNGAYWEAGFAEGIGIPVIYICEKDKFDSRTTHFNTNHLTTIKWSMDNTDQFERDLEATLRRSLSVSEVPVPHLRS